MTHPQGSTADLVARARAFAARAHEGQTDKNGEPYIEHPAAVAAILIERWPQADAETIAVAWLHDTVEDTPATLDQIAALFGARVADAVASITHLPHEPMEAYIARVRRSDDARRVKEADVAHNCDPRRLARLSEATRTRLLAKYARTTALLAADIR